MKIVFLMIFYLLLVIPILVDAGMIIEEVSYSQENPEEKEKTITYISSNRVKEIESDGNYTLWDLNKGAVYTVNSYKKIYSGGNFIEGFIKEIKESIRQIQKEIVMEEKDMTSDEEGTMEAPSISDEQFDQLTEDLEKREPVKTPEWTDHDQTKLKEKTPAIDMKKLPVSKIKLTIKKTEQTDKIAGYPAIKYEIFRDKKLEEEVWVSQDLEKEIKREVDYKKFEKLFRDLERAMEVEFGLSSPSEEYTDTTELDQLYEQGYEMKSIDHSMDIPGTS